MTANSIPLFNILMSTFKLRWRPAVIIGTIIAFFAVPWWYVSGGQMYIDYIQGWAGNYGILLGPIAGHHDRQLLARSQAEAGHGRACTPRGRAPTGTATAGASPPTSHWCSRGWSATSSRLFSARWRTSGLGGLKIPFPGGVIWYFSVVVAILLEWLLASVLRKTETA